MSKETILLIGGGGFLGSALTRYLKTSGYAVHHLLRQAVKPVDPDITVHVGGLGNSELLRRILPQFTTVVHLASGTTPGISARNPALEAELNIFPTLHFLELLHAYPDIHLVFVSSGGTLYGNPGQSPVGENTSLSPLSYYGAGKLAIEIFLQTFSRTFSRRVTILRPSNVYGPGQRFHQGFGVIRTMLQHVFAGTTMEIWGDGETVRDFIYIEDMADACMKIIRSETHSGVYNVGYGRGYSLNQLHTIIERVCMKKLRIHHRQGRAADVKHIVLDYSRIKSELGWAPKISLEEGIQRTWEWLKRQDISQEM